MNEKIKVTVAERTFLLTSSDEESYVQKVAESVDEQISRSVPRFHPGRRHHVRHEPGR